MAINFWSCKHVITLVWLQKLLIKRYKNVQFFLEQENKGSAKQSGKEESTNFSIQYTIMPIITLFLTHEIQRTNNFLLNHFACHCLNGTLLKHCMAHRQSYAFSWYKAAVHCTWIVRYTYLLKFDVKVQIFTSSSCMIS